jgi:tRNA (adenine37-N6)-methyltransferase
MTITMEAIGFVSAIRRQPVDDFWGGEEAYITLGDRFTADALAGITEFSHVEVLFLLDQVEPETVVTGARRPRGNPDWPVVGIFAQKGKGPAQSHRKHDLPGGRCGRDQALRR